MKITVIAHCIVEDDRILLEISKDKTTKEFIDDKEYIIDVNFEDEEQASTESNEEPPPGGGNPPPPPPQGGD